MHKVVKMMSNIGVRIRARREEIGMSQDDLAAKMGYKSRSTIAKIENGVNDVVQSNIVKFSKILNVSVAYLMGWEEKVEEKPVETAHKLADLFLNVDFEDAKLLKMIAEYNKLSDIKKETPAVGVFFVLCDLL